MLDEPNEPNERTTLLAKNSRRSVSSAGSAGVDHVDAHSNNSAVVGGNFENASTISDDSEFFYLHYNPVRFYLLEPVILILLFAYNLSATVLKNQIVFQTCTAIFHYDVADCQLLGGNNATAYIKEIETAIQPYSARIFMTNILVQSFAPAVFGVFIGAWSDRFGRKPLLITAFTGYTLYYVLAALISYSNTQTPISPWYYLIAGMPHALLGGNVTYSVAAFCFISDVSSPNDRPYRMVTYEAAVYIGLMIGSFASGFVFEAYGTTVVFVMSAVWIAFAMLIIMLGIPESLGLRRFRELEEHFAASNGNTATVETQQNEEETMPVPTQRSLFTEMLSTCFKAREQSDRAIIWLTISALLIAAFIVDGSMTVFYLFMREQFNWTVKQFTTYETFSVLAPIIGNLLGIFVLKKLLHMSVITLAILAFLSQAACSFMKGFAVVDWQIYVAIVLGALKSLGNPMCRTMITNLVPANELGKIFSFQSVLQSFLPFVASPIYTMIYSLTLETFPGFFNILSANLYLLGIAFFLVILRKKRNEPERYEAAFN